MAGKEQMKATIIPELNKKASEQVVKDAEQVKKKIAKPVSVEVKIDDTKMVESFNKIAQNISDALLKMQRQIRDIFTGFGRDANNGFEAINKNTKMGVQFSSFEKSISGIENNLELISGAFRQLGNGETEVGNLSQVFEILGKNIAAVVSQLKSMTSIIQNMGEKLNIDTARPMALIQDDIIKTEQQAIELRQTLSTLGESALKGKTFDFEKFNTANVQKQLSKIFSATTLEDMPVISNKLKKSMAEIFTLPEEALKTYTVTINNTEYKLEELAQRFSQVMTTMAKAQRQADVKLGIDVKNQEYENPYEFVGRKEIQGITNATQAVAKYNEELKISEEYSKRGFNVQIDQSSIDALTKAVGQIGSLTASLGEGQTIGIDPAQVEKVTVAFEALKVSVEEIANILKTTFGTSNVFAPVKQEIEQVSQASTKDIIKVEDETTRLENNLLLCMQKMKQMYDSGEAESWEYLEVLYQIIHAQRELWKTSGGTGTSYDGLAFSSQAKATDSVKQKAQLQDLIFSTLQKDLGEAKPEVTEFINWCIEEFGRLKTGTGKVLYGIFKENGQLESESIIRGLKEVEAEMEQMAGRTPDVEKAATVIREVSEATKDSSTIENKSIFGINQEQLSNIIDLLTRLKEIIETINNSLNGSTASSSLTTIASGIETISQVLGEGKSIGFSDKQINDITVAFNGLSESLNDIHASISSLDTGKAEIQGLVTSFNELKDVLIDIQTHIQNFDFMNMGKNLNKTQLNQLKDYITQLFNETQKVEQVTTEVEQKIQEASGVAVQDIDKVEKKVAETIQLFQESTGQFSLFNNLESQETLFALAKMVDKVDELKSSVENLPKDIPGQMKLPDSFLNNSKGQININDWLGPIKQLELAEERIDAKAKEAYKEIERLFGSELSSEYIRGTVEELTREIDEYVQKEKQLLNVQVSNPATLEWINTLETEYDLVGDKAEESAKKVRESLQAMANLDGGSALEVWNNALEQVNTQVETLETKTKESDLSKLGKEIENIGHKIQSLYSSGKNELAQSPINSLQQMYERFLQAIQSGDVSFDEAKAHIENFKQALESINAVVKNSNIKSVAEKIASQSDIEVVLSRMATWLETNKKLSEATRQQVQALMESINPGVTTTGELSKISKEFGNIQRVAKAAGETGRTFFDIWKQGATAVARYLTTFTSFYRIVGYVREAFTTIKDLDYALVDLRKTAHMTAGEFEDFYYNANDVAKQMGVTTQEIIEQASAWSRLGYNTKETASEMAALSSQFASISPGMSTDTAQTGLVSIMKAWDVDVNKVKRDIMDNINTLGNNFALTNEDIIQGMERAGATLSAIGMDIQGSFALFTGAQEVIQNAETVGTAIKTLSLRIRGYDEETEQLSDDVVAATGKVADLTKVASNNFAGVSLWADAAQTEYRSLVDYLGDIAEIWDEIDAKSRTQLLENLFGKRGASVGSAIIQNFDQVKDALVAMEEAAGSSDREMEIVQQSITYKLNELKQTWVGIFQDLIDRGDLGKLIDSLIKLSNAFADPVKNLTAFGAALGGIFSIGMRGGGILQKDFLVGIVDRFKNATRVINEYNEAVASKPGVWRNYAETQKQVKQALDGASASMTKYITGLGLGTASMQGYTASLVKNIAVTVAAKVATMALNTAINIGFAVAVSFAIKKITELIQRKDKLIEAAQKSAKALQEEANSLQDQVSKYNELSNKLKDSNLSESEIYNVKEQLYEIQKSLNDEYGSEAERLDLVNGKYEEQLDILQTLSKEKAHQYIQENQEAYEEALRRVSKRKTLNYFGGPLLIDNPENEDREAWKKYAEQIQKGIEKYVSIDEINGQITLDVEAGEAEDVLRQLYDNIEKWGKEAGEEASETLKTTLISISNDINKYDEDNEKLTAAKETIQAFQKAEVMNDDVLRHIYNDAIDAVEEYNKALATGKGIEEAEENLKDVRQRFDENTQATEEFGDVFQEVFDQVNSFAEDKHEIDVFFNIHTGEDGKTEFDPSQLTESTQRYLDVLSNYTDFELKGLNIDFDAEEMNGAETALVGLAKAIGVSEDNVDALIDKLVELGYVEGRTKEQTEELTESFEFSDIATSVENVNKRLKSQFDALGEAYKKIFYGDNNEGFSLDRVDTEMMENLRTTFLQIDKDLKESGVVFDVAPINEFLDVITSAEVKSKSLAEQQKITQDAVNQLATKYFYAAEGLQDLNEETKDALRQQFTKMGITNADEIVNQIQFMQEAVESLNSISLDDIDFTKPVKDLENELQKVKELQGSGIGDSYKEAEAQLEAYNSLKEKLAEGSLTVENATAAEIAILIQEGAVSEETGQAIALLKMQKILVNENALNEADSINELIRLAQMAGVATEALIELASIQAQIDKANTELISAIASGSVARIQAAQDAIAMLNAKAEGLKTQIQEGVTNATTTVQYESPQSTKNAKSGGSSAGKSYVDGFKDELSKLKEQYDRGEIDLQTYLAKYRDLIEKYFHDTEKYAEERAQALHDYLEELKGYYDSAISGVTTLLDHKIKAVQKEKDAALKAIEAERKAATASFEERISQIEKQIKAKNKEIKQYEKVIKALEKQKKAYERQKKELEKQKTLIQKTYIDPLNEEIEAIQKAADERERLNDLMQKQYNLEKLMNQRSNLVWICQTSQRCDVIKSSYIG